MTGEAFYSIQLLYGPMSMDLDHYTVEGCQEIIRRSGTALLWIKADSLYYFWNDMKQTPRYYRQALGSNSETRSNYPLQLCGSVDIITPACSASRITQDYFQ